MTPPEKPASALYIRIKAAFGNASDASIARRLNLTKQSVAKWKKGGSPSRSVLVRIAGINNIPLEWLMTGNEMFLEPKIVARLSVFLEAAEGHAVEDENIEIQLEKYNRIAEGKLPEPMTLPKFVAELQSLGVEDFNPAKGLTQLTAADMEEILAIVRSTVRTMVEQRIKAKRKG